MEEVADFLGGLGLFTIASWRVREHTLTLCASEALLRKYMSIPSVSYCWAVSASVSRASPACRE